MAFRVYSGPKGTDILAPIDKDRMLFKQVGGFEEAIAWARHVAADGRSVLLIEGDDGTHLSHDEIAAALQYGREDRATSH